MNENVSDLVRRALGSLVARLPKGVLTDPKLFKTLQRRGVHVLPNDFYSPVPDTDSLPNELWERRSKMVGVDQDLPAQLALLSTLQPYINEYMEFPMRDPQYLTEYTRTRSFAGIDGAVLYGMVRKFKPKRVIEVGSGSSTLLTLEAMRANTSKDGTPAGHMTAIEPYPAKFLSGLLTSQIELVTKKVEDVDLALFEQLGPNDILFIDSSHTVRTGGDVVFEILEVLPRLKPGVVIHFHDIFLPLEYPKDWVKERRMFWGEQYMLQAFLAFNHEFKVIWSAGQLQVEAPNAIAQVFPEYDAGKQSMGSFWLRRKVK